MSGVIIALCRPIDSNFLTKTHFWIYVFYRQLHVNVILSIVIVKNKNHKNSNTKLFVKCLLSIYFIWESIAFCSKSFISVFLSQILIGVSDQCSSIFVKVIWYFRVKLLLPIIDFGKIRTWRKGIHNVVQWLLIVINCIVPYLPISTPVNPSYSS